MQNTEIKFSLDQFPTTRYQGSKRKILDWIFNKFSSLEFETALDAFGGTASVSYLLKKMNKEVTYNDKYKFNHIIGKAIVENNSVTFNERDFEYIVNKHSENEYYDVIQKNFKSIYYTEEENEWLDQTISNIIQFDLYEPSINEYKKAIALYAVFQSCLMKRPFNLFHRKNLYLRTNDVERSFGNKTTWEKPFPKLVKRFIDEANSLVFDSGNECSSMNKSVFDIEEKNFDLVYLDPPYMTSKKRNETSDYLRCYHFLEGICNYSNWENLIDYETKNRRFKTTLESNDFKPTTAPKLLDEIISQFQESIIVLSYKNGGIPEIDYLEKALKKYKSNVDIYSQHYVYALNNQNGDAKKNREVLLIAY